MVPWHFRSFSWLFLSVKFCEKFLIIFCPFKDRFLPLKLCGRTKTKVSKTVTGQTIEENVQVLSMQARLAVCMQPALCDLPVIQNYWDWGTASVCFWANQLVLWIKQEILWVTKKRRTERSSEYFFSPDTFIFTRCVLFSDDPWSFSEGLKKVFIHLILSIQK